MEEGKNINMAYTRERIEWWKARSLLPDHQRAYDLIAEKVPREAQTVIDLGCGTGEMLRRLHSQNPNRAIIGTDNSQNSVNLLQQNLEDWGIESRVIEPEEARSPRAGVNILLDDILKSNIPSRIADTTLLTFPVETINYGPTVGDLEELGRLLKHYGARELSPQERIKMVNIIKSPSLASRITKEGGLYIFVNYDVAIPGTGYADEVRKTMRDIHGFFGLELESMRFIESVEINQDTDNWTPTTEQRQGYRISVFRKTSK